MLIAIVTLFAFYNSQLFGLLNRKQRNLIRTTLFFSFLFFITTGKIAAYIGLLVSIFCYVIYKRNFKVLVGTTLLVLIVGFVVIRFQAAAPLLYERLVRKVETRILEPAEGKENNAGSNFIKANFGGALQAFNDNPLTGSGIGGFMNRYGRYEVHSTYLKIIGETGLIGVIGYIIFMFYFLKTIFIPSKISRANPYANFLRELSPLIIGCIISWGYTYHLRKREFWIMFAIAFLAFRLIHSSSIKEKSPE